MITFPKMYGLQCDNCGADHESSGGYNCLTEAGDMVDDAMENGWAEDGEKHYCEACCTFGDDDELVIRKAP